jgi:hypothetical protein
MSMVNDMRHLFANVRQVNAPTAPILRDCDVLESTLNQVCYYHTHTHTHTQMLQAHRGLGPQGLNSPKVLKEKFGWSRTRAPGGPQIRLKNVPKDDQPSAAILTPPIIRQQQQQHSTPIYAPPAHHAQVVRTSSANVNK